MVIHTSQDLASTMLYMYMYMYTSHIHKKRQALCCKCTCTPNTVTKLGKPDVVHVHAYVQCQDKASAVLFMFSIVLFQQ